LADTPVRNRANEIAALLSDVDKIRQERRKAKTNRDKYRGVEGGMFNTASGSRYGGFGSDSFSHGGGGGGGDYGGRSDYDEYRSGGSRGSGAGGSSSGGFQDTGRQEYDEYEGADDFDERPARSSPTASSRASGKAPASRTSAPPPAPPKPAPLKKEVNLFDFDDDEPAAAPATASAATAAPAVDAFGDDDFDDFQQAPASASAATAAAPARGANANLFALLDGSAPKPAAPAAVLASTFSAVNPPAYSMGAMAPVAAAPQFQAQPPRAPAPAAAPAAASKKPAASTFDDLFSASLGAPVLKPNVAGNKTIAQMEKEKASNSLWGAPAATPSAPSGAAKPAASSASAFDDLLL
jgi:epsin